MLLVMHVVFFKGFDIFGMIVRSLMTNFIISKTLIIQRLSVILFLVVFIAIWVEEWDRIVSYITLSLIHI